MQGKEKSRLYSQTRIITIYKTLTWPYIVTPIYVPRLASTCSPRTGELHSKSLRTTLKKTSYKTAALPLFDSLCSTLLLFVVVQLSSRP